MKNINDIIFLITAFIILQYLSFKLASLIYIPYWCEVQYYILLLNCILSIILAYKFIKTSPTKNIFWKYSTYSIACVVISFTSYQVINSRLFDVKLNDQYPIKGSPVKFYKGTWQHFNMIGESIFIHKSIFPIVQEVEIVPHVIWDNLQFKQNDSLAIFQEGEWQLVYDIDKKVVVK